VISVTLENFASAYDKFNDYKAANSYYRAALKLKQEIGNKYSIAINFINYGDFYKRHNQFDSAYLYFKNALSLSQEIGAKDLLKYSYQNMSDLYENKADFKQSLAYYKLFTSTKDSIFNEKNNRQIVDLQTQYETARKDKKITEQNLEIANQKFQKFMFAFTFILITIVSVLVVREIRKKKKKVEHELLIASLKSLNILTDAHATKNIFSRVQKYLYNRVVVN
jgi:tetratricopeptide (TPR) repeat protein